MIQKVARQVVVPVIETVEKIIDVPVIRQVEVPQFQTIEKTVEVPQIQTVERAVEVPQATTAPGGHQSVAVPLAPVRQVAPTEYTSVTEVGPPVPPTVMPGVGSYVPAPMPTSYQQPVTSYMQ